MANYWCSSCRIFIADNKISRTQHESSSRHKSGVSKVIKGIHIKKRANEILTQQAERELNRIRTGGEVRDSYLEKKKKMLARDIEGSQKKEKNDEGPKNEAEPVHEATIGEWIPTSKEPTAVLDDKADSPIVKAETIQPSKVLSKGQKEINEWCLDDAPKIASTSTDKPQFRKRKMGGQRRERSCLF